VLPPLAERRDVPALVAAAAAEGGPWDLSRVRLAQGWENVVLATGDGWILRFPRNDRVDFTREMAVLRRLADRLPVPIPAVSVTGRRTRFAAYRALTGTEFDAAAYLAAPARQRDRLAASLARFLAAMHTALTPDEVAGMAIPPVDHARTLAAVAEGIDRLAPEHRGMVQGWVESFARTWAAGTVPGPRVVLHNDFHLGNMVLDGPVGELAGVWDFSVVAIGEPSFELRYVTDEPADLTERVAGHYQELTGHVVDLAAASIAIRMESALDVITTGVPKPSWL
jgi:aminoglycoside phosphotransferase (APT) family kinase protein